MRGTALLMIDSIPWAIEPDALERMRAIAARVYDASDADLKILEAVKGSYTDDGSGALTKRDGVATLAVNGPIFRRASAFDKVSGATDTGTLARDFSLAMADPDVHSVVLSVDSPGGEAAGIAELASMIRSRRGEKPIVAYVDGSASSGAYWLASAADRIVMNKASFAGSIGVVSCFTDTKGLQSKTGVVKGEIVSGNAPKKRPDPTTEAGRREIQARVDDLETVFVEDVALGRGLTREKVLADFGQGGVKIAADAVASGMADSIGDYEPTLSGLVAAHKAKVESEQRRRAKERGFYMAGEHDTGAADDVAAIRKQLEAAEASNRALSTRLEQEARERLESKADQLAMDLLRPDRDGLATLFPNQRETFVSLYATLGMIDRNFPQSIDGRPVKLSGELHALIAAGPKHSLLAAADEGAEPRDGDEGVKSTHRALRAAGLNVVGDVGTKKKRAADDVTEADLKRSKTLAETWG